MAESRIDHADAPISKREYLIQYGILKPLTTMVLVHLAARYGFDELVKVVVSVLVSDIRKQLFEYLGLLDSEFWIEMELRLLLCGHRV